MARGSGGSVTSRIDIERFHVLLFEPDTQGPGYELGSVDKPNRIRTSSLGHDPHEDVDYVRRSDPPGCVSSEALAGILIHDGQNPDGSLIFCAIEDKVAAPWIVDRF